MFADAFGLQALPFNNAPDPRFFFSTPAHEEALASCMYSVGEQKGMVLLAGPPGTGKTLLGRMTLAHFENRIFPVHLSHTPLDDGGLIARLCSELGIQTHAGHDLPRTTAALRDFLLSLHARRRPVVLLFDDAHAASIRVLEELRIVTSLEAVDSKLLQVILVGHPELNEKLDHVAVRQLKHNIFRTCEIPPFSLEQTRQYVRHRLAAAGAQNPEAIFDELALSAVHEMSRGIARTINTIADNAMLCAYARETTRIDASIVRSCLDARLLPEHGTRPDDSEPRALARAEQRRSITSHELRGSRPDRRRSTSRRKGRTAEEQRESALRTRLEVLEERLFQILLRDGGTRAARLGSRLRECSADDADDADGKHASFRVSASSAQSVDPSLAAASSEIAERVRQLERKLESFARRQEAVLQNQLHGVTTRLAAIESSLLRPWGPTRTDADGPQPGDVEEPSSLAQCPKSQNVSLEPLPPVGAPHLDQAEHGSLERTRQPTPAASSAADQPKHPTANESACAGQAFESAAQALRIIRERVSRLSHA